MVLLHKIGFLCLYKRIKSKSVLMFKCKISVEINSNVSKMIQAYSLLFNFQMKSPCYLVTLSLESSDFQTFLKQYVILVPFAL